MMTQIRFPLTRFFRISLKGWLILAVCACILAPPAAWYYAHHIATERLRVRHVCIEGLDGLRILQVSDIHYNGDPRRMNRLVRAINRQEVDLVCFTGDLVSDGALFPAALAELQAIRHPVYGVLGNHDYGSGREPSQLDRALRETGGRLLKNESVRIAPDLFLVGLDEASIGDPDPTRALQGVGDARHILLFHEPIMVEGLQDAPFLLALSGHSHGGQVRIPLIGAPVLPFMVGRYDWGFFATPAGPLYVSCGIGTYGRHVRLFCPPEIVVFSEKR